jgi:hypothetical protein
MIQGKEKRTGEGRDLSMREERERERKRERAKKRGGE